MAEDIFKYTPVTQWNGYIVQFGLPSTDGNMRLTEIVLGADSCLEATKNAIELSWVHQEFQLARTSPVLEIIRTLFGGDGPLTITFPLIVDGVYYIMGPPTEFAVEFPDEDWEVKIVKADALDLAITFDSRVVITEIGTDEWWQEWSGSGLYWTGSGVITQYSLIEKHAENPYWDMYTDSNIYMGGGPQWTLWGQNPAAGDWSWGTSGGGTGIVNWDIDGAGYVEVKWVAITGIGSCTDGSYPTHIVPCESSVRSGYCRQTDFNEPLIISNRHTGRCSNNDHKTRLLCEDAEYTWTSTPVLYSNKEEMYPAPNVALRLKQPMSESSCAGLVSDPDWAITTAKVERWNNVPNEFVFIDLETPFGIVPGSAVITKIRFKGDFSSYKEFVEVSFGNPINDTILVGVQQGDDSGYWQDGADAVFSFKNISPDLEIYQGKTGFWSRFTPSYYPPPDEEMGISEGKGWCVNTVTGEEITHTPYGYKIDAEWRCWQASTGMVDDGQGGEMQSVQWVDGPWWGIEFTIVGVEETGVHDVWNNGGKCLYTSDQWQGGAGEYWSQEPTFTTRELCMETSQTMPTWNSYYLMWIEQANTWTKIYHNWAPGSGSSTHIPSSNRRWGPPGGAKYSELLDPFCFPSAAGTCSNSYYDWPSEHFLYGQLIDNDDACEDAGACTNAAYHGDPMGCTQSGATYYSQNNIWYDGGGDPETQQTCEGIGASWVDYGGHNPDEGTNWENLAVGNTALDGTINHHKAYNLWTADNHRKYPKRHIDIPLEPYPPYEAPAIFRMHYYDTNFSWGNGSEVGRSSIAMWITNTFAWPDHDKTYEFCQHYWTNHPTEPAVYPGEQPLPQWSMPLYDDIALGNPYPGWGCHQVGVCTNTITGAVRPEFENDEIGCRQKTVCSRTDGYSYYGSPALQDLSCTHNGFSYHEWNPTTESWDLDGYNQMATNCWGSGPGLRPDGTYGTVYQHYACVYGGVCSNNSGSCESQNYGNYYYNSWGNGQYGSDWNAVYCAGGKWTREYQCLRAGVCEQWWYCTANNCNEWRLRSGFSAGSHSNPGSNNQDYCDSLATSWTTWCSNYWACTNEYTTWTSDNNTWDNSGFVWNPENTWTWGRNYWWKTYPKIIVDMPINLEWPEDHIQQDNEPATRYLNLMFPAHQFVNSMIQDKACDRDWKTNFTQTLCTAVGGTWGAVSGWCSSDGTWQGNEICENHCGNPTWPFQGYNEEDGCNWAGSCSDPQWTPWNGSYTGFYQDGRVCEIAGTCHGNSAFDNDNWGYPCTHEGVCYDSSGNVHPDANVQNDEIWCLNRGTCDGGPQGVGNPTYDNREEDCENQGTCSNNPTWDNYEDICLSGGGWGEGGIWTSLGYYFTNANNTFISAGNVWESHNNIWTHEPWSWLDWPYYYVSEPSDEMGYHTQDRPEGALIRWKPPQSHIPTEEGYDHSAAHPWISTERKHMRPSHYRIYRAPWVSPEGLSLTGSDYEANMWRLAGEVASSHDYDYHYFTDTRADLIKLGVAAFEHVYYRITAVWKNWNWKQGYEMHIFGAPSYPDLDHMDWDQWKYATWSHFAPQTLEGEYEILDGGCSNNVQYWISFSHETKTEEGCLGSGTCSWPQFNNDEAACTGQGHCLGLDMWAYNNNESGCIGAGGTWDPAGECIGNSSYDGNSEGCLAEGICDDVAYNNNEPDCISAGTCSDSAYNNSQTDCESEGTCVGTGSNWINNNNLGEAVCIINGGCAPDDMLFDYDRCQGNLSPGTCSDPAWNNNMGEPMGNSSPNGCLSQGTCSNASNDNYMNVCLSEGTCYGPLILDADLVANIPAIYLGPAAGNNTSSLTVGMTVEGYGIPAGTTITQIPNSQSAIISNAVTAGVYGIYPLTFGATVAVPGYQNWEVGCLGQGTCVGNSMMNNWLDGCTYFDGTCSDPTWNGDGFACLHNNGTCVNYPIHNNNYWDCYWAGFTFIHDNTWTPDNTWIADNTWTQIGVWTQTGVWSPDNTWSWFTWQGHTWTGDGNSFVNAENTWDGPFWTSDDYTWTDGSWDSNPLGSVSTDVIEDGTGIIAPHDPGSVRVEAIIIDYITGNNGTYINNTFRFAGYFRAPETGEYTFEVHSRHPSYLWLGANGESTTVLAGYRDHINYVSGCPGSHGYQPNQFRAGRISLVKGHVYPLISYFSAYQSYGCRFLVRVLYPPGDFNDGAIDDWRHVQYELMPESMSPTGGVTNQLSADGQTVEGCHTNQYAGAEYGDTVQNGYLPEHIEPFGGNPEEDIYSFYTDE